MTVTPYEALVESASRLVETDALADLDDQHISEAATLLERNRPVLDSARHFLGQQCSVPVRYERSFFPGHIDEFSHLRNLARVFRAEARLAASDGDYAAAAHVGVDLLELANAIRRGGLVVDLLVGIAVSGNGTETLREIRARLFEGTRLTLRDCLRRLEDEREPFADICARDQAWERAVGYENTPFDVATQELMDPNECGLSEDEQRQVFQLMQEFSDRPELDQQEMQHTVDRHVIALMRMLSVDLALRSRYASANSFPPSLETLVPQHLLELPMDPFTGDSFVYRPVVGGIFLLYSTGPKQADHGGTFGPWPSVAAGVADLCLDENDYWQECCVIPTRPGLVSRIAATLQAWRRV